MFCFLEKYVFTKSVDFSTICHFQALNLRTGVLEAQDEANHRWQVLICLPWLEGNKIRFSEYLWCFKKAHVFDWVYGSWMIKYSIFLLGFFRIRIWFIKPKSRQIRSFFFEWPFSKKFYIHGKQNPPVLWRSNGRNEKSQFLDVVPLGKGWFSLLCSKMRGWAKGKHPQKALLTLCPKLQWPWYHRWRNPSPNMA